MILSAHIGLTALMQRCTGALRLANQTSHVRLGIQLTAGPMTYSYWHANETCFFVHSVTRSNLDPDTEQFRSYLAMHNIILGRNSRHFLILGFQIPCPYPLIILQRFPLPVENHRLPKPACAGYYFSFFAASNF